MFLYRLVSYCGKSCNICSSVNRGKVESTQGEHVFRNVKLLQNTYITTVLEMRFLYIKKKVLFMAMA